MPSPTLKTDESTETDDEPADDEEVATEVVEDDTSAEEVDDQSDPDDGKEEEEVATEEVELPDDDDDDDEPSRGFLRGSTFGVSNAFLLGVGIVAVLLVLYLMGSDAGSSTRQYDDDEQVDEEIDEGADGAVERDVTDAGGSVGRFDPEAQDSAIDSVFG